MIAMCILHGHPLLLTGEVPPFGECYLLIRSAYSNGFEEAQFLIELHEKLWGREDLFCKVFHAVDLTKEDFIELQSKLHDLNPSRNSGSYVDKSEDTLKTKLDFLRTRITTYPLTSNTDSLVPKVVFRERPDPVEDAMDVDIDATDATDDDADESEDVLENVKYIDKDAAALSHGATPVFPCTIRYMDLTFLDLQHFSRVSKVLLIRDEWDVLIDIFNERKMGIFGSAVWTGQPGIGR